MAVGGFIGSDPYPTLAQFQQYVANGESTTSSRAGWAARDGATARSPTWVQQHYTAQTVDGRTVYDLTAPAH